MELSALRRYIVGESPTTERRRVEAWAEQSAERRRYLDALRRLYHRVPDERAAETAVAWQRILRQMKPPSDEAAPSFRAPWDEQAVRVNVRLPHRARVLMGAFHRERSLWTVPVAAAAAILLAVAGLRLSGAMATRAVAVASAPTMRTVTTMRGQRAEIRLDDGTHVVLGVDSRLRFAADFGTSTRDVYLDGTAFFRVVHDAATPFTVHTANAVTRDMGTQFVVRSYRGDGRTVVVVTEGAVGLGTPGMTRGTEAVLTRDQLGVLTNGRTRAVVTSVDPARYTAWMNGELVFRDTPLRDVVRELGRWYDTDVELGDSTLARTPFSASFAVETLQQAIATMTTVLPLRAVRRGKVVLLYRR